MKTRQSFLFALLFTALILPFLPAPTWAENKSCSVELDLVEKIGIYTLQVKIAGMNKEIVTANMLVDTGAPHSSFYPHICKRVLCKDKKGRYSPVVVALGEEGFLIEKPQLENSASLAKDIGVDGILGNEVLMAKDLILDFKRKKLCVVKGRLDHDYLTLGLKRMSASYDSEDLVWVDFEANGTKLKYFIDTGSNRTSFSLEDIKKAQLPRIGSGVYSDVRKTGYNLDHFGPVTIALSVYKKKLQYVSESPSSRFAKYTKLGNDFLSELKLGFSAKSKYLYFSEQ